MADTAMVEPDTTHDAKVSLTKLGELKTDRQLSGARFSPTANLMASGGLDATIRLWHRPIVEAPSEKDSKPDPSDGWQELPPISGHRGWVEHVLFATDGSRLYSCDSWGRLACHRIEIDPQAAVVVTLVWELTTAHDGWIREVALSPDGSLLATCGRDGHLKLWNAIDGTLNQTLPHSPVDRFSVRFHPVEPIVACGDASGVVTLYPLDGSAPRTWDAKELYLEQRLQEVGGARRLCFSPDGQTLLVGGTLPKNGGNVQGKPVVLLFDWKTGTKRSMELGTDGDVYVCDMQFHTGNRLFLVTSGNPGTGQVLCVNPTSGAILLTEKKLANCHGLSIHPNGEQLAVTSTNTGSNGNGRRLDKEGNYPGNWSPVTLLTVTITEPAA